MRMKVIYLISFLLLVLIVNTNGQILPKALLITGNGNVPNYKSGYPPWIHEFHNPLIINILKGIVHIDTTEDLSLLNDKHLSQYDMVISNSLFLTPEENELDALYKFVAEDGKSYLTLHSGILSLLNWKKYEEFIGGIFIGGPATVPEKFKVATTNAEFWGYTYSFRHNEEHPVSRVVDDFKTKDELYHFQPSKRDFYVIARAENHPVMWWHPVGKGKVMSLTLGHDEEAKSNPGYQSLLQSGVRWLLGIPLIYGAQPRVVSTRDRVIADFLTLKSTTHSPDARVTFKIDSSTGADIFSVTSTPDGEVSLKLTGKTGEGTFNVSAVGRNGLSSSNAYSVRVIPDGTGNIATYHGNIATASSYENESPVFAGDNILDGDFSTRWSSAPRDSASITIDLRKNYPIGKVVLHWEASYAIAYDIEASADGKKWTTIVAEKNGDGGTDLHAFKPVSLRYLRVNAMKRAQQKWGYSLYEISISKE